MTHHHVRVFTLPVAWRARRLAMALIGGLGLWGALPAAGQDNLPQDLLDAQTQVASVCPLVSALTDPPVIVIGSAATDSQRYAAQELAEHLGKMTRRPISVVDDQNIPQGARVIAVGKSSLTDAYDLSSLGVEQYIIDITPDRVVIVGGRSAPVTSAAGDVHVNDRGTLYGVYDFLESLGVRWYRPEPWGWHIPTVDAIELPVGRRVSPAPAFIGRSAVRTITQMPDPQRASVQQELTEAWAVRQRLNVRTAEAPRYGGTVSFTPNWHAHSRLIVPPGRYLKSHPEYFALVNGKRGDPGSGRTPQLCLGNPQLQEVFAQNVIALAKANPQWYLVAVDPEDGTQLGTRMCTCPLCTAMDDPSQPTVMSKRVFTFTNIIARKAAQAVPGLKLGLYAYSMHTQAPALDAMEPNVIVGLANINSWSDWTRKLLDPASPQNANFMRLMTDWKKISPHPLWMREYSVYGWLGPVPMYRYLQDRVQTYRQMGVEGMVWPGEANWGSQLLLIYLKARLQWNPDLDLAAELDRFYANYYGPAAEPMKAYHQQWMAAYEASQIGNGISGGISSGGRGMHVLCNPALIASLGRHLQAARARVQNDPLYSRRLKGEELGWEFCRRVSEILSIKLAEGVPTPLARTPATNYLRSDRAQEMWNALVQWLVEVNAEDLSFDLRLKDGKPAATAITYLKRDLLENGRYGVWDERRLLESQGFGGRSQKSEVGSQK